MTTRGSKLAELPIARRQGQMFSSRNLKFKAKFALHKLSPFPAMQLNMVDIIQDMFSAQFILS
jgi:hypothetical protein